MRHCPRCAKDQPDSEFARHSGRSTGFSAHCRSCCREYMRSYYLRKKAQVRARNEAWRVANREADLASKREYGARNRERIAEKRRSTKYGVSAEQYAEMVARQKGRCAICEQAPTGRGLAVDHCHETGVVRGLLCTNCNQALGKFRDDARVMRAAADYVAAYQERILPPGNPRTGQQEQEADVLDNPYEKDGE